MLGKLDNAFYANDTLFFYNEDFDKATFIANQIHIFAVDLDEINIDNDNILMKMILILLFMSDF